MTQKKAAFHTLGCKVNQYETEAMAEMFRKEGYEIVGERDFADVYVINTCTVTAVADKKSRQYIRRMKKVNPDSIVAVTGCYAQTSPEEVSKISGVDIIAGTNEKHRITEFVRQAAQNMKQQHVLGEKELTEFIDFPPAEKCVCLEGERAACTAEGRTRAYIKIQEGCNRFCSYCVIPYARGPVRSRPLENIVREAEALIGAGFKEIVLTGINTAQYDMEGRDLFSQEMPEEMFGIEKVINAVSSIPGDFRIRLSSLEPAVVNAEYVQRLFRYDKLCHHLHMSAQSGSDSILKAMNRPYDTESYYGLVNTLFDFDPCYGISTDIIVGFPGEREKDFEESCSLVTECSFCRTHIFKYSKRPFTKAAGMTGQVSPQVKSRRSDDLEETAKAAAAGFFEINLAAAAEGRTERVLLEEEIQLQDGSRYMTGYTGNYIRTYIPESRLPKDEKGGIVNNRFVEVKLADIFRDGMLGEPV